MKKPQSSGMRALVIGLGTAGMLVSLSAGAILIDFEDVATVEDNPIVFSTNSRGFNFSSAHHHVINNPPAGGPAGLASNGTQYIAEEGGNTGAPITMTRAGGGTFSLASFDAAEVFVVAPSPFPNATILDVLGNLSGGGIVSISFVLDGIIDGVGGLVDFQSFLLPASFTNLVSVVFSGSILGGSTNAGISLDNLNAIGAAALLPEPGTLGLLVPVLAGWGLRRRIKSV